MEAKLIGTQKVDKEELARFRAYQGDVRWRSKHDAEICEKYKGKYIAVANQEIFVGDTPEEVFEKAQAKYPNSDPHVEYIPLKKEFWLL